MRKHPLQIASFGALYVLYAGGKVVGAITSLFSHSTSRTRASVSPWPWADLEDGTVEPITDHPDDMPAFSKTSTHGRHRAVTRH
jgi:hypothetical protein